MRMPAWNGRAESVLILEENNKGIWQGTDQHTITDCGWAQLHWWHICFLWGSSEGVDACHNPPCASGMVCKIAARGYILFYIRSQPGRQTVYLIPGVDRNHPHLYRTQGSGGNTYQFNVVTPQHWYGNSRERQISQKWWDSSYRFWNYDT